MIHVSQIMLWETQWCHQLVEQINSTLLDCSWWSLPHWGPDQPACRGNTGRSTVRWSAVTQLSE